VSLLKIASCRLFDAKAGGLSLILTLGMLIDPARADDWPQWRGPGRDGVSHETGWLEQWPASGPPVVWKANVGIGFSSFAVANNRVYTAGNANSADTIFCLDAHSGKVLWQHSYPSDLGDKYFEGGATATPTVDGNRVYTSSRWGDVFCFDAASGKVIWSRNLATDSGLRVPGWGFAGSPLVFNNLLVLNMGEAGVALDKQTGATVWKSANKDSGYSSPLPFERDGKWFALLGSGQAYIAVDLQSGAEAWRFHWVTQYGVNAADPIVDGDRALISTGYGKGAVLLKMAAGEPQVIWKSKVLHTQLNPAVRVGPYVYGLDGDTTQSASLKCIELATGAQKWEEPAVGMGGLIVADGQLILLTERGELIVAPATPDGFKVAGRKQVLGGKCWTAPVLANGYIFCRSARGDVVCVDVTKPK